ncbi:MAG: hypothetical protein LC667_06335 [Thioalkalivibrio sp.]|nr:hypothetical protein [Thioalkalivibrio sp.]
MMRVLLTAAVVLIVGCNPEPPYSVVVANRSGTEISEAYVSFDSFRSAGGSFYPGQEKTHGDPPRRIPRLATVAWRDSKGKGHVEEIEVSRLAGERFEGDLVFVIGERGAFLEMKERASRPFFED